MSQTEPTDVFVDVFERTRYEVGVVAVAGETLPVLVAAPDDGAGATFVFTVEAARRIAAELVEACDLIERAAG